MPTTTQKIAKEVPLRVHEPKDKAKPKAKQAKQSLKRVASESEVDSEQEETELIVKKKISAKRQHTEESQSEIELIEEDVELTDKAVESVNEQTGDRVLEVSTDYIPI